MHPTASAPAQSGSWPQHDVGRRGELRRFGLWMFLATVSMLFAAFTSAYIVRRSGSDWQPTALPSLLWVNTGVLAMSSCALEIARGLGLGRRWRASAWMFGATLLLGAGFVGGQALAWRQLVAAGVYLPSNPHASFVFMMTGAHAVHVVAALLVLGWGATVTWRGLGRRDFGAWTAAAGLCRTFWHYLGTVWLWVFLVLSAS
jgi:cytochrome c oxidase subunit 3